jgi:predicted aspartyl protease
VSIEFPLQQKLTPFGLVSNPTIPVTVRTPTADRIYAFLLDTGADFSVAPRRLARQIGLDWETLPEARVLGVEQGGVRARLGPLPLHLVDIALTVRCLFVDAPRVPFILGRADFLDRFVLTIDPAQRRIILTELP